MSEVRNLRLLRDTQLSMDIKELAALVNSFTIFEKIEFSPYLTKERIRNKLKHLREVQVPNRTVHLKMDDEAVVEYWLKNYIHPALKHWVYPPPKDKTGCSKKVLERDMKISNLRFYENGQHNYSYTLQDIEDYLAEEKSND